MQLLGAEEAYAEHYDEATSVTVSEWVLWHEDNPNSVVNCVTLARENARSVREQISSEMWEAINTLFLLAHSANRRSISRGPRAFFESLRNGAHLFQGTADATMTHGEPYEFIRLGLQLERAETTVRVVASRYPLAAGLDPDDPARARQMVALLESCSAFEAFVKRHGTLFEPATIAEELIRSPDFPRAVRFCLAGSLDSLTRISSDQGAPHRILGRLVAELAYGEADDHSAGDDRVARAAPDGDPLRRRGRHEGVLLEPGAPRRRPRDAGGTATAMWLTVEHTTRFSYGAPINEAYTEIRLKPAHRDGQRCSAFTLTTEPRGVSIAEYRDRFGNTVHHFDVLESHTALGRRPQRGVDARAVRGRRAAPTMLDRWDLLRASRYVPLDGAIAALAAEVDAAGPTLATAIAAMHAVRGRMTYETGATDVYTIADEALSAGHGVCQDFAHVMIGVCRVHGIPARYVSGYLYDPQAPAAASRPRTRGSTCGTPSAAGCRSTRRTTASRPTTTCASASAATTRTCRRRAASTRGRPTRRSRSPFASASSDGPTLVADRAPRSARSPSPPARST